MRLSGEIQREQSLTKFIRQISNIARIVIMVLIAYPFIFPLVKLKEFLLYTKEKYWINNIDKLEEKSLEESINYIKEDISRSSKYQCNKYYIYNSRRRDEIHFSNAFYLHEFIGWGFYRDKRHKWSRLYYRIKREKLKLNVDYEHLFNRLKTYFASYEDIKIEEGIEPKWKGEQPYFTIEFISKGEA